MTEEAAPRPPSRSVRLNAAANYASLAFSMAASIVVLPIYLRLMGAEAFGLVGVFTLLNTAFQVFDAGLSQTFARECARYAGGARDIASLRRLLVTFEIVFAVVALAGAAVIVLAAPFLATHWLHAKRLPSGKIETAIALMGAAIAAQWVSGLYRGVLMGIERQVVLAGFNIAATAARTIGPIAILIGTHGDPVPFFVWQAAVSGVELAAILVIARRMLRAPDSEARGPARQPLPWGEFRGVLRFSSGVAFTAVTWLLLLQGDKFILSRVLSLADYGVFTLAVTASTAVAGLGAPIGQAILPRLTRLHVAGEAADAHGLYSLATQATCVLGFSTGAAFAVFARPFLMAWTGDARVAGEAAPILTAYAVGGGLATVSALPYYLQYAVGTLRLHVIGQILMVALLLPALVVAAAHWGAVGTGVVWTAINLLYLLLWTPIVHGRFVPALRRVWLTRDLAPIALASGGAALILGILLKWPASRLGSAAELGGAWLAIAAAGALASTAAWATAARRLRRKGPAQA